MVLKPLLLKIGTKAPGFFVPGGFYILDPKVTARRSLVAGNFIFNLKY